MPKRLPDGVYDHLLDEALGLPRAHGATNRATRIQYASRRRRIGAQSVTLPTSTTKPAHRYGVSTR